MIEPQLCANGGTALPRGPRWIMQPKLDGWRAIAVVGLHEVCTLWTRAGNAIGSVPYINEQLAALPPGTMLDGEIMANDFNDTQSLASRIKADRTNAISFYVFDVLEYAGENLMGRSLEDRLAQLDAVFTYHLDECPNIRRVAQAPCTDEALVAMLKVGFEGGVAKHLDGRYRPGKRSQDTLKFKPQQTVDLVVTGTYEASPGSKYAGKAVGGLLVDHNGVELRVGTGMNDDLRMAWFKDPSLIVGKVVEVGFNAGATERSGKGKKRHPSLKRVRHPLDKSAVAIKSTGDAERAVAIEATAIDERAVAVKSSEPTERAVGHEPTAVGERSAPTPRRRTVENRMRNYKQMRNEKLFACLRELEAGEGPAYDRCVNGGSGDPQRDLQAVRAIVLERELETA